MTNKLSLRKVALLLMLCISSCTPIIMHAQSGMQPGIKKINGDFSEKSILRLVNDTFGIDCRYYQGVDQFYFVDLDLDTIHYFSLPQYIHVYDFELYNQYVVFCGINTAQRCGLIGWFDAAILLAGSGTVHCYNLNNTQDEWRIRELGKMDIKTVGTTLHVMATAKYRNQNNAMISYGLVELRLSTNNLFLLETNYYCEKGGVERYDDITAISNGFVATIYKINGNAQYCRKYTSQSGNSILQNDTDYQNYRAWGNIYRPEDNPALITRVRGNTVATVFFSNYNNTYGLGICVYNANIVPPTLIANAFIPISYLQPSSYSIDDFIYSHNTKLFTTLITNTTNGKSDLYSIIYNAGFVYTSIHHSFTATQTVESLALNHIHNTSYIITSGYLFNTYASTYNIIELDQNAHCSRIATGQANTVTIGNRTAYNSYDIYSFTPQSFTLTISTNHHNVTTICN